MDHPQLARIGLCLAAAIAAMGLPAALAGAPDSTDAAGVTLEQVSAEVAGAATQTNGAGVTVELVAADDASVDTTNAAGVTADVGQLDPGPVSRNAAGIEWLIETGRTQRSDAHRAHPTGEHAP